MNCNKAYRELRAWAVRHGLTIEIQNMRPRRDGEAHIQRPTAFSSKPFTEIEFGYQIREKLDWKKAQEKIDKLRKRRMRPLFK